MVLAVDGTNFLYRSFHALSRTGLRHAGRPVWAVHGLLNQLCRLIADVAPSHLIVAFDTPHGAPERRRIDPGYKVSRTAPVPDLAAQLAWAPSALRQAGVVVVDHDCWEADDLLASTAATASRRGWSTVVATADRDAWQLLADDVAVVLPDGRRVTEASLLDTVGVSPSGYATLAALRGEPSDDLPGVRGIGQVTAARLVAAFGTLDGIGAASDTELRAVVGPAALTALRRELDVARRCLAVGTLRRDLDIPLDAAALADLDPVRVRATLTDVGLGSLANRFSDLLTTSR